MNDREAFQDALHHAKSTWVGCQWWTQFGSAGLNLAGLRSRQAALAAKATRGEESQCWCEAAIWLIQIERDAALAAELAQQAFRAAELGNNETARQLLNDAVELERKYRAPTVYPHFQQIYQLANPVPESLSLRGN